MDWKIPKPPRDLPAHHHEHMLETINSAFEHYHHHVIPALLEHIKRSIEQAKPTPRPIPPPTPNAPSPPKYRKTDRQLMKDFLEKIDAAGIGGHS